MSAFYTCIFMFAVTCFLIAVYIACLYVYRITIGGRMVARSMLKDIDAHEQRIYTMLKDIPK